MCPNRPKVVIRKSADKLLQLDGGDGERCRHSPLQQQVRFQILIKSWSFKTFQPLSRDQINKNGLSE